LVEREHGVLAEINSRCVLKLDLRTALAGDEAEAGLDWDARGCLSPGTPARMFTLLATADANIALDKTDPDDLIESLRRSLGKSCGRRWLGMRGGDRVSRRCIDRERRGQKKKCETTAGSEAAGSPPRQHAPTPSS